MHILTDLPDQADAGFGVLTRPADPADLPADQAAAWSLLAPGAGPLHAGRLADAPADRVLVFVDHARRSQFDVLREALAGDTPLPRALCALARTGSGFHGNHERPWATCAGNLHLTAVLRRPLGVARAGAGLSMLPVAAVAGLLAELLPPATPPEIKWVNDVLLGGRKVSGVLTASNVQGDTIDAALFGIGLNVAAIPALDPTVFVPAATRLGDWLDQPPPPVGSLAATLLDRLDHGLEQIARHGPGEVLATYRRFHAGIGRHVRVWLDQVADPLATPPLAAGRLDDLHDDLSLQIAGHPQPLTRGRLAYEDDVAAIAGAS